MHRLIFSILLSIVWTVACSQTHLEQVVKRLKSSGAVTSTIYTEHRNPQTKQLEDERTLLTFDDQKYDKLLKEAMEKDRPNATEYHQVINVNSGVFKIVFQKEKSETTYTLISPSTLSISVSSY